MIARTSPIVRLAVQAATPIALLIAVYVMFVGHNAPLRGWTVWEGSLVGSGSVGLDRAIVRGGSFVGANGLGPGGMEVPPGAMALGVPARLREDAVTPGQFEGEKRWCAVVFDPTDPAGAIEHTVRGRG